MNELRGIRVAILEARMSSELSSLVRRHGGVPYAVPAVVEAPHATPDDVIGAIDALSNGSVVVLTTGAGVDAFFGEAEELGRAGVLKDKLDRAVVVCRGPKPVAALKARGVAVHVRAEAPYTTRELVTALATVEVRGKVALVLHYGERSAEIVDALASAGGDVRELMMYEWRLPEDTAPLERLVDEIVERRVGAVAFTSQIQARHLFAVADRAGRADELRAALRESTIVASIGPTCTRALHALGVTPHVEPENPKMGPLVAALGAHLAEARGRAAG